MFVSDDASEISTFALTVNQNLIPHFRTTLSSRIHSSFTPYLHPTLNAPFHLFSPIVDPAQHPSYKYISSPPHTWTAPGPAPSSQLRQAPSVCVIHLTAVAAPKLTPYFQLRHTLGAVVGMTCTHSPYDTRGRLVLHLSHPSASLSGCPFCMTHAPLARLEYQFLTCRGGSRHPSPRSPLIFFVKPI